MNKTKLPVEQRFWAKVDKSGDCWEWQGSKRKDGYGRFRISAQVHQAHRVVYELTYGSIPDGLLVRHTCDNPSCCNPEHLITGTDLDNSNDKVARGRDRYVHGEAQHKSKFTIEDVVAIRSAHAQGFSDQVLAQRYGVTRTAIYHITRRKNWKHI